MLTNLATQSFKQGDKSLKKTFYLVDISLLVVLRAFTCIELIVATFK